MRSYMFVLVRAACGPQVFRYKVQASLGAERVDAFQVWPSVGDSLVAGARRFDPSPAELKTWEQKAGWLTYAPDRSCFGIVSHQIANVEYHDGTSQQGNPTDFTRTKYTLVTASGQTLVSEPPTVHTKPLQLRFEGYNAGLNSFVPALEHWVRSDVEVCFATPKPLAEEKWVKWIYAGQSNARDEITFTIDGGVPATAQASSSRTQDAAPVLELTVDALVTGSLRNKAVRLTHQPGRIVMRGTQRRSELEGTLTLEPHVTCVFRGTAGRDSLSIPSQTCRDNPRTTVEGNGISRDQKSMELTMKVTRAEGTLDLVMELTE